MSFTTSFHPVNVAWCPVGKGDYYPKVQSEVFLLFQVHNSLESNLEHLNPRPHGVILHKKKCFFMYRLTSLILVQKESVKKKQC